MIEHQLRILLVDDHEIVRRGLKTVLEDSGDLVVIGEAGNLKQGVAEALRLRPDVTVMDLRLPDGSGVEACRQIRAGAPGSKVLILTSYANDDALYSAVMAGAAGYILKDLDARKLRDTLHTIAEGGSLLDPKMTTIVLERLRRGDIRHPADDPFSTLTPQEDRILALIGDGLTNREIAARVSLSEKTVKNYVSHIYAKLHVARRSQATGLVTERRIRREQV
jgi:two-component system, NarL family, response regulator DevR